MDFGGSEIIRLLLPLFLIVPPPSSSGLGYMVLIHVTGV